MALSALRRLHETDSPDYSTLFPQILREQFGFTFAKFTALPSQGQTQDFTTGDAKFMSQDTSLTVDSGIIRRMSPGIIRDVVRQFARGPEELILPLTARGAVPFAMLMIHDKTRQVFWLGNGQDPVRLLDKNSEADRNTVSSFFEYRSLLPPTVATIDFDEVSDATQGKANLRALFSRVRSSDDFTKPPLSWTDDEWTRFVVRCRIGDPDKEADDTAEESSFDTFLRSRFGDTLFAAKDKVVKSIPDYKMVGTDLSEWIRFVLNVRSTGWNALYLREIGIIFNVIGTRLVLFTLDKNVNMVSCLSTSIDPIKYNNDNDNARTDDYESMKTMLRSQLGNLLDPRTLDRYSFDSGNRMLGDWQRSQHTSQTMPRFTEDMGCKLVNVSLPAAAFGVVNFIARKVKCTTDQMKYLKKKAADDVPNDPSGPQNLKSFVEATLAEHNVNFKLNPSARTLVSQAVESLSQPEQPYSAMMKNLATLMNLQYRTQWEAAVGALVAAQNASPHVPGNVESAETTKKELESIGNAPVVPPKVLELASVTPFDPELAQQTFDAFKSWLNDGNAAKAGLRINTDIRYVAKIFNSDVETALTQLLEFIDRALKEEQKGVGKPKSLKELVDIREKEYIRAREADKSDAKKKWDKAKAELDSNTDDILSIQRHLAAAKDFAEAARKAKNQQPQMAERALRNALLNPQTIPHADEGTSSILLLHAFLMYFFDVGGVRSPGRDWDAVKPKDAEDVSRMIGGLLGITS
jgi:hypothetical protein